MNKNNTNIEIEGKKFFLLGRWVSPVLEYEMWLDWCETKEAKELGIQPEEFSIVVLDGNHYHPLNSAYTMLRDIIYNEINKNDYTTANKIIDSARIVIDQNNKQGMAIVSKPDMANFNDAITLLKRIRFPWNALFAVGDALDRKLLEISKEYNKSVEELSIKIPHLRNALNEDQQKLFELKQLILQNDLEFDAEGIRQKNIDIFEKLKDYQTETEYIGTHHFWGTPRDIYKLLDSIKNSKGINTPDTQPDIEFKLLFETIALVTKYKLECNFSADKLQYKFRKTLTDIAEKFNIDYDDIIFLTSDEINNLNKNNIDVLKKQINNRKKAYGILKYENKVIVLTGDKLEKYMQDFGLRVVHKNMTEIKGSIASKGKAIGKAAVLLTHKENYKIHEGMILIAPETTPEFMPAMIKAAAFVTDIGGITSHAGIIAREMRKPCIIGTKIATQVLRDGDLVEVDANLGIIKILKEA